MALDLTAITARLKTKPEITHYYVAYSGGRDSHVLLHLMHRLREQSNTGDKFSLSAIHVDHNLQSQSKDWAQHCANVCRELNIPLQQHAVHLDTDSKHSLEALARDARHAVYERYLVDNDCAVLLAHHADDQAETLFQQLIRGAGVAGLSAMPFCKQSEAGGNILRPLLYNTQQEIADYAGEHHLHWVDDPSNADTRFERNYLRHKVLPAVFTQWPKAHTTLQRVTEHQAEAMLLVETLARIDLAVIEHDKTTLNITQLKLLDLPRQKNVLRYWFKYRAQVAMPGTAQLQRILSEVINAKPDATPEFVWAGQRLRRYQNRIYLLAEERDLPFSRQSWDLQQPLQWGQMQLVPSQGIGQGISQARLDAGKLLVDCRQGGESCRPAGKAHSYSLKSLFQEWNIPPWQRSRVPLIYIDNKLAQVVGYCVCDGYQAAPNEPGVVIESLPA